MNGIPFCVLRHAYQWALDTETDNLDDTTRTYRDYWPTCVAEAIEDWRNGESPFDTALTSEPQ